MMTPAELANLRTTLYDDIARGCPALARGLVRCEHCHRERRVDARKCLRNGWPTCCGHTMRLVTGEAE